MNGHRVASTWGMALILIGSFGVLPARGQEEVVDGLSVRRSPTTGLASFVRVTAQADAQGPAAAPQDPTAFLQQHAALFGVEDVNTELAEMQMDVDLLGRTHTVYDQYHQGIRVFGGQLRVHRDVQGRVYAANGDFFPVSDKLPTIPAVGQENAEAIAAGAMGSVTPVLQKSELVIVDPGWYGDPARSARLAWYVILYDNQIPARDGFFVDALSGELLDHWDLIHTARNRKIRDANGTSNLNAPVARAEGQPPHPEEDVNRAYDYAGDVYDYFFHGHGRDSINGNGIDLEIVVYFDSGGFCPNAFWNGEQMVFCPGTVTDDIMAHELTHGVTDYTADLIYQNQSGQLNESFSDVFGELVDLFNGDAAYVGTPGGPSWPDHPTGPGKDTPNNARSNCSYYPSHGDGVRWLLGEDATAFGGEIRDMWDPTCFGDPDESDSPLQVCQAFDNGGVHIGSGIPNHAFAIVTDGKTFNDITVQGIGPIKAGAVWYRALSVYLTPTSDFVDSFDAFTQAATDLVGTTLTDPRTGALSTETFTTADAEQVRLALLAVEMDRPGTCGGRFTSTPPTLCDNITPLYEDPLDDMGDWAATGNWEFQGGSWFCPNRDATSGDVTGTHRLTSPEITLDGGLLDPILIVRHRFNVEYGWDGGIFEISVNGAGWKSLRSFLHNGYSTGLYPDFFSNTNPLEGQPAFTGNSGSWGESVADLSELVSGGETIRLRFTFGEDFCCGTNAGWTIDTVSVQHCGIQPVYEFTGEFVADDTGQAMENGSIDPGETVQLNIELTNVGNEDALDVTSTLSATSPTVLVEPGFENSDFPDILIGEVGTNVTPFKITVSNEHEPCDPINLQLDLQSENDELALMFSLPTSQDPDSDGDEVGDLCDNCPDDANEDQADLDVDGYGDVCDNCPNVSNEDQADNDGDLFGDVCDNCPDDANADQADADFDGIGDVCDACPFDPANDEDGDGVCGDVDICPVDPNPGQEDEDQDGLGDVCDNCPADANPDQADGDGDGAGNACDNCPGLPNPGQTDTDGDGTGDECDECPEDANKTAPGICGCGATDEDTDADKILDCEDLCLGTPAGEQVDADGCTCAQLDSDDDGTIDCDDACPEDAEKLLPGLCGCGVADVDDDGDEILNCFDVCPNTVDGAAVNVEGCSCDQMAPNIDRDKDGTPDCRDNCPSLANITQLDSDGDGIGNACDNCTEVANADQADSDEDGLGDVCDTNSDTPGGGGGGTGGGGTGGTDQPVTEEPDGTVGDDGMFEGSILDDDDNVIGQIIVAGAEPGSSFEFDMTDNTTPGPGSGTFQGFVGGVGLGRTLNVTTDAPDGYTITLSIVFTLEELEAVNVDPEVLEMHVLNEEATPATWIPAGANIGESEPTGVVGESGYFFDTGDDTITYWVERDRLSAFAVGWAGKVISPTDDDPTVDGGGSDDDDDAPSSPDNSTDDDTDTDTDEPSDTGDDDDAGQPTTDDEDTAAPALCGAGSPQALMAMLAGMCTFWFVQRRRR